MTGYVNLTCIEYTCEVYISNGAVLLRKTCYNILKWKVQFMGGLTTIPETNIKIKRIWEDTNFFELNFDFTGFYGTANINIYTSNDVYFL